MPMNPYHLEIVSHSEIDEVCAHNFYDTFMPLWQKTYRSTDTKRDLKQSNFFTLSSFGVTHFINGKPEFYELEQWKREVRTLNFGYRKLTSLQSVSV